MSNDRNVLPSLSAADLAEACDDAGSNDSKNPTFGDVTAARFGRREFLRGALAATAIAALPGYGILEGEAQAQTPAKSAFDFPEVSAGTGTNHAVAEGYNADILIRWGDPLLPGAPAFDPLKQTPAAQKLQFGYNNDYLGYVPVPGAQSAGRHGLLCVNHEFTSSELMFPGLGSSESYRRDRFARMTREQASIEMAAVGGSVVEIRRTGAAWQAVANSKYARRIDADTPMTISGPAAGHRRMRTKADPEGRRVLGTFNNCAGGMTPWGTWLTCEENINLYFRGSTSAHPEAAKLRRFNAPANIYAWGAYFDRFDVSKEPYEINRFGWVVEIDPLDPSSTPKKRTALGRFKHEGAEGITNGDGRYAVYSGDDERFDYVYKFVTEGRVDPANRAANMDLLDFGVLSVARFNADGSGDWLPLVHGLGPLTADKGFASQADVVIDARLAADALGATKMDRPEDIEVSPATGKVYVNLTNNANRNDGQIDAANPRANNRFGHIVEITPDNGDHGSARFRWEILVKCGGPGSGASFHPATSPNGGFGMPDNLAFDASGRLWVATDGMNARSMGRNDGLWALETEGPLRGLARAFFRAPDGAETSGPCFTPDGETLFLAVQHPGAGGDSMFELPATRWPDFRADTPPRPSIVAITKKGGGKIG